MENIQILHKDRAILIHEQESDKKYLIVGDLHIGFEEKFRAEGISIKPDIEDLTSELISLVEKHRPTDLLINGDVKSGTDRISKYEWEAVPKFFERMMNYCRVSVIPGNHDGGLNHLVPNVVEIQDANGVMISGNLVLHGHTRPLPKFSGCKRLIIGHVHPIYMRKGSPLSGQPVWIFIRTERRSIFPDIIPDSQYDSETGLEVVLIPSFNLDLVVAGYSAETARAERKIAPILRSLEHIEDAMVVTLDGDLIGDASLVSKIL